MVAAAVGVSREDCRDEGVDFKQDAKEGRGTVTCYLKGRNISCV